VPTLSNSIGGSFKIRGKNVSINWLEIHLEEDTAKSSHEKSLTKIDCNKSGVPLLEMVTGPDFKTIEDATEFCKQIQFMAKFLGISEADMEKGHLRLEANISVRKKGDLNLPNYKVELKNINSFGFMKKALEYEFLRQVEAHEKGEKLIQETRGFNETRGETFSQRNKEDAHDYRYFPEPDIPALNFNVEKIISEINEQNRESFFEFYDALESQGLSSVNIKTLASDFEKRKKFKELIALKMDVKKAANIIINNPLALGLSAESIIEQEANKNSEMINDESFIIDQIEVVLNENPKAVGDFRSGNQAALQFLIGQVMKNTKGKADAATVKKFLVEKLSI
jgi:aspartyl-tRNA(Asn)/glutamyl-tRNA(Gln) amidotransferase subunit B